MMKGYCDGSALPRHDPTKKNRVVLELSLPKPGGHVLSPDFNQVRRWAVIEMGLENIHGKYS
jgi:hypothetical protein